MAAPTGRRPPQRERTEASDAPTAPSPVPTPRPSDFAFSNFQPARIVGRGGIVYPTVEHAYQAAKTLDPAERRAIAAAPTPGKAKRMGRKVTLRPDWEEVKEQVMLAALRQKFAPGTAHAARLIAWDGPIVEITTWHDMTWGVCICPEHRGNGRNRLGALLEMLRDELRAGAPARAP